MMLPWFVWVGRARRLGVGQAIMACGFVCRRSFPQEHLPGRRLPNTFLREHVAAWLPRAFGRARTLATLRPVACTDYYLRSSRSRRPL
jgi:hypothetical protein